MAEYTLPASIIIVGNSYGIRVPKRVAKALGAIDEDGKPIPDIVLTVKIKRRPHPQQTFFRSFL